MFEMNEEIARKVIDVVTPGLSEGLGKPIPGHMCVEAAVCYALGLPHSDDPGCVESSVRSLKIALNDSNWSSNQARAKGMMRLAVAQLGSLGVVNGMRFSQMVAEMTIRNIVPIALRSVKGIAANQLILLENAAVRCETEGSVESARAAFAAADAYAFAAADAYAYAAANAANAARAAACADVRAAAYAAAHAARAARAARAANAARAAACAAEDHDDKDSVLSLFSEEVVKILVDMKSPGSEYLYLTEK